MSNNLYNTPFEMSLHVMLLLTECRSYMALDRITVYDFITTHSAEFGITEETGGGKNGFAFSEYALKRKLTNQALKSLVLDRLVLVSEQPCGFMYQISETGENTANKLQSEYAQKYRRKCQAVIDKYQRVRDAALLRIINRAAAISLREGHQ